MNCMNCGALLPGNDVEYCPHCGANVLIQKKVDYLSKYYYNQGLEKASIRDLSGAITCLKQSLVYDKKNIQARNLLGLVYFETGEVVAALSEWVISKNLKPVRNLASEYISKLQSNPNRLNAINETIKKYNHALELCRQGHEDMAAIQLKKVLSQNSKLIKGYHLLALIQIKQKDWGKARRTLKKALRIDKTNTTTLRFLKEIDEQTGVTARKEGARQSLFHGKREGNEAVLDLESTVQSAAFWDRGSRISGVFTLVMGFAAGIAAFWFLLVPVIRQGIYKEANEQIINYSESMASQGAELTKTQGLLGQSDDTVEAAESKLEQQTKKAENYQALFRAYRFYQGGSTDEAAEKLRQIDTKYLESTDKEIYDVINVWANGDAAYDYSYDDSDSDSYDDSSDYDSSYDDYDSSYDDYDSSYDDYEESYEEDYE